MIDNSRKKQIANFEKLFADLYGAWESVRKETIESLGTETAFHIIDFHGNNWFEIIGWINSEYNHEERTNIVFTQFHRLFKEIHWFQFLFLNANYPMIYRNLRYILEMMAQAYYIDSKSPDLEIDDQMDKVRALEEKTFGWRLVSWVFREILNSNDKEIRSRFKGLWDYLNKHVHSSAMQMDMVVREDPAILMTDSFNETLAKYALKAVDEIFDLIYVIIFARFPKTKKLAATQKFLSEWREHLPYTTSFISAN